MKLRCPTCHGRGKIELDSIPECRQRFLKGMAKLGTATAEQIHKACGNGTALNATHQMLWRLNHLGLVRKVGEQRPAKWKVG